MTVKKVIKNGIIKYVRVKESEQPEEDNQKVVESTPLREKDHKDLEIKRLTAIIELLESRIKQLETDKPKEESPSSDMMAVAAASTYDCYK
jgi:hypothetical protein